MNKQRANFDQDAVTTGHNQENTFTPTFGARFNPILGSDENEEGNEEFPGFFVNGYINNNMSSELKLKNVDVALLLEATVVSVGRRSEGGGTGQLSGGRKLISRTSHHSGAARASGGLKYP
ncbi:Uncharacterized protein Fot_36993 [Forsythia ovata]|uniref:Uncharacterized protein n=1 Tax=Forsythia ovata TaxID=205694 RepID=A0ABD1SR63_9LAMI